MNVVLLMTDTYRYDNLAAYAKSRLFPERGIDTPCLDKFAEQSYLFERAYFCSFPTVPTRQEMLVGHPTFVDSIWAPLPTDEVVLQQVLSSNGYLTQLIADTPHILQHGYNYQRGFDGFEWIRGQENDHWKTSPRHVQLPCDADKLRSPDYTMVHYLRNTAKWQGEEDCFCARTMQAAMDWLEDNKDSDPFFLYVDTFDPHEPWDAPQEYVDRYDPGYTGQKVTYPQYAPTDFLSDEELQHCRAMYAGEATLVDRWLGKVIDKIDALGLGDDTAVIVTSDHGFGFGDHGVIGKSVSHADGTWEAALFYEELARVPLMIRLPGQKEGKRIGALSSLLDVMPTVLELCDIVETDLEGESKVQVKQCGIYKDDRWRLNPDKIKGASLVPLMRGETDKIRDIHLTSSSLIDKYPHLARTTVTTDDGWCLFYNGCAEPEEGVTPYYPIEPQLFYLPDDPHQERNIIAENRAKAEEIHQAMLRELVRLETPEDILATRKKLFRDG